MKVLVLSDSHSALRFMRSCIQKLQPDVLIHLGDHFEDGAAMAGENPHIPVYQVPGNCDDYRMTVWHEPVISRPIGGVNMYLTHGHKHRVKQTISFLLRDARAAGAAIALYGHTHQPDLHREEDGLWVMNPGSAGYGGGSAGLIHIEAGAIVGCRLYTQWDLEEIK